MVGEYLERSALVALLVGKKSEENRFQKGDPAPILALLVSLAGFIKSRVRSQPAARRLMPVGEMGARHKEAKCVGAKSLGLRVWNSSMAKSGVMNVAARLAWASLFPSTPWG